MAKKIPQRMCVGCRQMRDKNELLRIVRTTDGAVEPDATGKLAGRGAYLCPQSECLAKAKKSHSLERGLRVKIDEELYAELASRIDSMKI